MRRAIWAIIAVGTRPSAGMCLGRFECAENLIFGLEMQVPC